MTSVAAEATVAPMIGRRAVLCLAAGAVTAGSFGRARAEPSRLVEIRLRVALPPTQGEARVWLSPWRAGGAIAAAETHVEGDADVVETDLGGAVSARWRPGALSPRLLVVTRASVDGPIDLERLAPWAETAAGRVVWGAAPGPCFTIEALAPPRAGFAPFV